MKTLYCQCGQTVYFDSSACLSCGHYLAYSLSEQRMLTLEADDGLWRDMAQGGNYRLCANRQQHEACNGVVDSAADEMFCLACRLNNTIPDLSVAENLFRWRRIELAKRRLLYGLLSLDLPLSASVMGKTCRLSFEFLEDQRSNPNVPEEFVSTGHRNGVITINVLEADDVQRARQREQSAERYRTVLGHFRHEAGHFYYELLVVQRGNFERLFGNPQLPYDEALKYHYDYGPRSGWQHDYISAYASVHPLEDWAECFAHYLHTLDTIETAVSRQVIAPLKDYADIDSLLVCWNELAVSVNELNRSLGLRDAYPFVVTPVIADKLRFVHAAIQAHGRASATG